MGEFDAFALGVKVDGFGHVHGGSGDELVGTFEVMVGEGRLIDLVDDRTLMRIVCRSRIQLGWRGAECSEKAVGRGFY